MKLRMEKANIKKNKFLLYRNIFIMKPLSILTITYNQTEQLFKIFVYNSQVGELYRKQVTLK